VSASADATAAAAAAAYAAATPGMRQRITGARRIVIKVGTNVVMSDEGPVAVGRLYGLVESVAALRRAGRDVLLVSSGAVGLGAERLGLDGRTSRLVTKQACAAVGQSRLMALYEHGFERLRHTVAQVLLTEEDFSDPLRLQNLRATLDALFGLGVIPIVNENDTVSTAELERVEETAGGRTRVFGDNDKLSALLAAKVGADLLILLSDVDGLYTKNPARAADAELIPLVREVSDEIASAADGGSARGRGGMATKLEAARIAAAAGAVTVIANGRLPGIVDRVCGGEAVGTVFLPAGA
jgi:glutamate 5-kinase